MCLILFQLQEHPKYKLTIAANRDEAYNRPTKKAHYWEDKREILAGRDLLQMGTWLGITSNGRFAALTNYRNPAHMKAGKYSRGQIVSDYLASNVKPDTYLKQISMKRQDFTGFNILVGDADQLMYYNNIEDTFTPINPGIHGLSNHFLSTPWPKVETGKSRLQKYLNQTEVIDPDKLFQILADTDEANESLLPDTGIGLELEKKLSPMFIKLPDYGTRSSTVITIDYENFVSFSERTFEAGELVNEVNYQFQIK